MASKNIVCWTEAEAQVRDAIASNKLTLVCSNANMRKPSIAAMCAIDAARAGKRVVVKTAGAAVALRFIQTMDQLGGGRPAQIYTAEAYRSDQFASPVKFIDHVEDTGGIAADLMICEGNIDEAFVRKVLSPLLRSPDFRAIVFAHTAGTGGRLLLETFPETCLLVV